MTQPTTEMLLNYFMSYLFTKFRGSRHVRRVAPWLGFIAKAIEDSPKSKMWQRYTRQLMFYYRGHWFKVRYDHQAGPRGGIQILEYRNNSRAIVTIESLNDAAKVYHNLQDQLD